VGGKNVVTSNTVVTARKTRLFLNDNALPMKVLIKVGHNHLKRKLIKNSAINRLLGAK